MAVVRLGREARKEFDELPFTIQGRVRAVFARLTNWPHVSGAKALRGTWSGCYRIRTGDWRVLFRLVAPDVLVVRIQHRRDVYDDE